MKLWLLGGALVLAAGMCGMLWRVMESGEKYEEAMKDLLAVRRALQTERMSRWANMRGMRWQERAMKFVEEEEEEEEEEIDGSLSEDVCDLNKEISSPKRARQWRSFWKAKYGTLPGFIDWSGTLKSEVPEPDWESLSCAQGCLQGVVRTCEFVVEDENGESGGTLDAEFQLREMLQLFLGCLEHMLRICQKLIQGILDVGI
eukprot:752710-Hanusia_phi.AAC.8